MTKNWTVALRVTAIVSKSVFIFASNKVNFSDTKVLVHDKSLFTLYIA